MKVNMWLGLGLKFNTPLLHQHNDQTYNKESANACTRVKMMEKSYFVSFWSMC
jgi:hypothetical protein